MKNKQSTSSANLHPARKKCRLIHSKTRFNPQWQSGQVVYSNALCTVCSKSFSVCRQDNRYIERHMDSLTHKSNCREVSQLLKITSSFLPQNVYTRKLLVATEVKFTGFVLEHNLPFDVADHAGLYLVPYFPSSYNKDHLKQ